MQFAYAKILRVYLCVAAVQMLPAECSAASYVDNVCARLLHVRVQITINAMVRRVWLTKLCKRRACGGCSSRNINADARDLHTQFECAELLTSGVTHTHT